ncbi:M48 family metallopeptidase [Cerasicoccus frondis]|uniref:M48 family metallopeptidase n=1 Tax=Cerasicoccus frondis TaxID=490090 RepID=UPI0028528DA0|nr:YgjP-like metallopeptidase domain-containing protein [Cerasicoccus frondis]
MSQKQNSLRLVEVSTSQGALMVPYEIRRSRRARYIRLTVGRHNHALLSVPWRCAFVEALEFLRSQGDWLARNLSEHPTRTSLRDYLERHPRLYGLGKGFRLSQGFTRAKPFYVYSTENDEVELRVSSEGDLEQNLVALVRAFAQEVIEKRTFELADEVGVKIKRVSVRDQATRWGSCSSSGTISLNWRLVLLRTNLQEHVIYHELAHVKEMNHSASFWDLLRKFDANTDAHNEQLNPAGARLMPLGRS